MDRETIFRGIYSGFFYIVNIVSLFNIISSSLLNLEAKLIPNSTLIGEGFTPYTIFDVLVSVGVLIIAFGVIAWYFPKLYVKEQEEAMEKAKIEALKRNEDGKKRKSKSKSRHVSYLVSQQHSQPKELQLPKKESKIKQKITEFLKKMFINKDVSIQIAWIVGYIAIENVISYTFINYIVLFFFPGLGDYWVVGPILGGLGFSVFLWFLYRKYGQILKKELIEEAIKTLKTSE